MKKQPLDEVEKLLACELKKRLDELQLEAFMGLFASDYLEISKEDYQNKSPNEIDDITDTKFWDRFQRIAKKRNIKVFSNPDVKKALKDSVKNG